MFRDYEAEIDILEDYAAVLDKMLTTIVCWEDILIPEFEWNYFSGQMVRF